MVATYVSCVPDIPVEPVLRKVGAGAEMLAAVMRLGGIVLENITL